MDIAHEIRNHLEWIDAVASLLDSEKLAGGDLQAITSHDQCALGKWLNSDDSGAYRNLPEFHQLVESHQAFHELAGELILSLRQGKEADAMAAHGRFIQRSREVISLLRVLEAHSSED